MADQKGWFAVAGELWDDLIHSDKVPRLLRVMIVLLLLGGTVWSGYLLKQMAELVRERSTPEIPRSAQVDREIERLGEVVDSFRGAVMARAGSSELSVLAATISRRPFVPPPPPPEPDITTETAPAPELVEPPPFVMVRAVLVKGDEAVAVLDIEGEGSGVVIKRGGTFGRGKGRIVRITADKVVFTWAGQSFETAIGM